MKKAWKKSQSPHLCIAAVVAILCAAFMTSGQLYAVVIDFEDNAVSPGGNIIGSDITSGGFFFESSTNHTHLMNDAFGLGNGTTYLVIDDFKGTQIMTISPVGGGAFSLQSIDFGEAVNETDQHATFVNVTGNFSGGGVVTKLVDLDLIFDGPGGANDFQTEFFNWSNLVNVVLDGGGQNANSYYGIDNMSIPEPATICLLGLGGFLLRRRKHS